MRFVNNMPGNVTNMNRLSSQIFPSYTIFTEGGTIYAESSVNGLSDYNGSVADTVINNALTAVAGNGGGDVVVKIGNYTINSVLSVGGSNVGLIGEGKGTKFTLANSKSINVVEAVGSYTGQKIGWFEVDGNKSNNIAGGDDRYQSGIHIAGANTQGILLPVWTHDCIYDGIMFSTVTDAPSQWDVYSPWSWNNDDDGLDTEGADYISVFGGQFKDNGSEGLNFTNGAFGNKAFGVRCNGNGDKGISINGGNCWAIGCRSYNNTGDGILVRNNYGNILEANRCYENSQNGIFINNTTAAVTQTIIANNICYNNSQSGAGSYDGIKLAGTQTNTDIQIFGNRCYDGQGTKTQQYGINVANSNYVMVKNNNCRGNLTAPYSLSGAQNTYDGKVRTATSVDLNGSAETLIILNSDEPLHLARATLLYTEASSADTGISILIGKESDSNYYYDGTSEVSKAQWYTNSVTLLKNDVAAGDTVTFYSAGSKSGAGEIMCIIDYCVGA